MIYNKLIQRHNRLAVGAEEREELKVGKGAEEGRWRPSGTLVQL